MTNQRLGHSIPLTRNPDTTHNAGVFRLYFLQIPESEHFQALSLSFEISHFWRYLEFEDEREY